MAGYFQKATPDYVSTIKTIQIFDVAKTVEGVYVYVCSGNDHGKRPFGRIILCLANVFAVTVELVLGSGGRGFENLHLKAVLVDGDTLSVHYSD